MISKPILATRLQVSLQIVEAGNAVGVFNDDLAVDERRAKVQLL
jgi:hypothetical protein